MKQFLVLLTLVLTACGAEVKRGPAPSDLIPRDTMVMVMFDMNLLESHVQMTYGQVSRYHKIMKESAKVIFDKYHITEKRYDESLSFYGTRQEKMSSMYNQVLDSVNRMLEEKSKEE